MFQSLTCVSEAGPVAGMGSVSKWYTVGVHNSQWRERTWWYMLILDIKVPSVVSTDFVYLGVCQCACLVGPSAELCRFYFERLESRMRCKIKMKRILTNNVIFRLNPCSRQQQTYVLCICSLQFFDAQHIISRTAGTFINLFKSSDTRNGYWRFCMSCPTQIQVYTVRLKANLQTPFPE